MKNLFTILILCSLIACNSGGTEEKPAEDQNAPTSYVWRGRVMSKPDSTHWVPFERYNAEAHVGYDTIVKVLSDTEYSGELPQPDTGLAAYLADTAGHVISKGWIRSQYGPTGGGMVGLAAYNPSIHVDYRLSYYYHINK